MNGNFVDGWTMRKTADLVQVMLEEAKTAWLVAIAVGFYDDTQFVFSSSQHPVEELNSLVKKGGFPIGLLRFDKEEGSVQGSYRPFPEYEKEAWAATYLAGLLENTGNIVAMSQQPVFRTAS
jgi:hypothetical protein